MKVAAVLWKYDKRKNGTFPVKIRISHEEKSYYFPINAYLNVNEWDKKKMRAQFVVNAQDINFKIMDAVGAGEKVIINGGKLKDVKKAVLDVLDPHLNEVEKVDHTPLSYFKQYIDDCKSGAILHRKTKQPLAETYIKSLTATHVRLLSFVKDKKPRGFEFDQVNETFYTELVNYLRFEYGQKAAGKPEKNSSTYGIKENTIGTTVKRMLTVFKKAKRDGYLPDQDFQGFHIITQEVDKIALTESEIEKIKSADLSKKPHLDKERDRFFVAYNFMLRFNDSIRVESKNISIDNGRAYFRMMTEKTKEPVYIPIMPFVFGILEKNEFKVSRISNQKSNDYLKDLGKAAGITDEYVVTEFIKGKRIDTTYKRYELITTHTTRRSAATNLYLSGMDLNSIRMFGGWKSIKQLLEYIKVDKMENAKSKADHPFFMLGK